MGPPSVAASDREVEWQLDALDLRPVERWLSARLGEFQTDEDGSPRVGVSPNPPPWPAGLQAIARPAKRLVDSYLDTADWRIVRSGFVLRTRRRGGVLEATMKDLAPAKDGLRDRMEVTEAMRGTGVDELDPDGPVGRRVRALAGARALRQVLEVRTRRRLFSLVVHDEPVGEVGLDDTTVVLAEDPRRLRLQRVEVEVLGSWVGALQPFVEQLRRDCGLQPATLSKFEAGLMAAGVAIPGRSVAESSPPGREASLGELTYAVLRRDTAAMLAHEPGTRLGDDPEALHQMRVSTRRLRAALALFGAALPVRAARLSDEIGWLASALGAVRDLDVQLEDLDQWCEELPGEHGQALDHLRELLLAHREEARGRLLETLESRRYERLVGGLRSMLEQGPAKRSSEASALAVAVLPELISQRHRAALRAAKRAESSGELTDFHRLRLRCKRLRYAIEFTSGLYANSAKRFGKHVATLQDHLGRIQDAVVAYERLHGIAATAEGEVLSPATVFAMGMAAQHCRELAAQRLEAVSQPTELLRGPEWRRLLETLEKERRDAADRAAAEIASRQPVASVARVRRMPPARADVDTAGERGRPAHAPTPLYGVREGPTAAVSEASANGASAPSESSETEGATGAELEAGG